MAGPTIDTFTISNLSYSGTTLEMTIKNATYGMKNPSFTIGSDSGDISVSRSGYLSNPYVLTVVGISLTAGNTYNLSIDYSDNADTATNVSASGTFTIPSSGTANKIVQLQDKDGNNIFPLAIFDQSFVNYGDNFVQIGDILIQWGSIGPYTINSYSQRTDTVSLHKPYNNSDFVVSLSKANRVNSYENVTETITSKNSSYFNFYLWNSSTTATASGMIFDWIAIGKVT